MAVFLDYDGVLTPIVEHPDLAVLAPEMRRTLEALAAATTVAIVSGRDVDDVIAKVAVPGLFYAGSHGLDIRAPSGAPVADDELARFDAYLADLDAAETELNARLQGVPGTNVERKRFAIAVHYRQVPEEHHDTVAGAVESVAPEHPSLRVAGGKMIFELRPDIDWDKGKALMWLLAEMELDRPEVIPVYLGDDVTDEDAFRVIRERGVGVVVGREDLPSLARYALADPGEVRVFLDELRALSEKAAA
ncbi:MAG: trehalose-phosphatase [Miltoncostaeaceae bacterium]